MKYILILLSLHSHHVISSQPYPDYAKCETAAKQLNVHVVAGVRWECEKK